MKTLHEDFTIKTAQEIRNEANGNTEDLVIILANVTALLSQEILGEEPVALADMITDHIKRHWW